MKLSRQEFEHLRRRVAAIESVMSPAQRAEADLLQKAAHVVDVARSEGMLPADYNGRELYALTKDRNG